ncbi:MAG: response regulator [Desulfobacterales bacterium]|nr:response regulator [Desulfobacterales bacterium]
MFFTSLKMKLGLAISISGFFIIISLIAYTTLTARSNALDSALKQAVSVAREYAGRIKAEMEVPMNSAKTLAQAFSAVKNPESPLHIGRYPANVILKTILEANDSFLATYSLWEPNAFDGMDEKHKDIVGQDSTGRFMPYWTRNSKNELIVEPLKNYENEGIGDYYLIPKKSKNEAVISPSFKDVQGRRLLVMSVVAPVVFKDVFYGITGIDISLEWLQQMVDRANLYKNAKSLPRIQIFIISNDGTIAAAFHQTFLAGKHLSEIQDNFYEKIPIIKAGKEVIKPDKNKVDILTPLRIGNTENPWAVNIIIPSGLITAEATSQMWENLIISAIISVFSLFFIIFFLSKLTKPLVEIADAAEMFALGDLVDKKIKTGNDEIGKVNKSFKKLVTYLREITSVCKATAIGDFSKKVEIRSENDILGISVNQMAESLRAVVKQANNIAKGDYSIEITPKSEHDELGIALSEMTLALRKMNEENETQNWLKNKRMELNEKMRGENGLELDISSLCQRIINHICNSLQVGIGGFYVLDEHDNNTLRLMGSYAYQTRKKISNIFKISEGIVGQAAYEKKYIIITDCPDDYIKITSGLGETIPRNILCFPFLLNNKLNSVIEIGSLHKFTDLQLTLLDQVSESIAIAINTCSARMRMENLLRQTQQQAELLQAQQEELRQTNEELEEQTKALKASEARLQEQQEELRQANEELEEQTQLLEEQKSDIEKKNIELKNARRIIEEKAKDIELSSKYKSEFLANMSHELRTPLNSILLLSKMLSENKDKNLSSKQIEFASTINASGADLLNLINDILDLSKVESGKMVLHIEDVRIDDIASSMKRNFQHIAQQKKLNFIIDTSQDVPKFIRTDQQRLEQIIKNFFSNAFKFTSNGSITLKIFRGCSDLECLPGHLSQDNLIGFSIIDTGIGIPKDKQKLIFEAFQQVDGTTSRKYGGTGLGLSISRELAKLLGGFICLSSKENEGSCFTLYISESFPKDSKDVKPSFEIKPPAKDISITKPPKEECKNFTDEEIGDYPIDDRKDLKPKDKSILIIEDDPVFAKILCDLSHERGFRVIFASDGETGLALASNYEPSAILLDIGLPGISGWSVMSNLKDNPKTRHIPVHFITASDRSIEALKMGAIGYLIKPVSIEKLNQVYEKIESIISKPVKKLLLVEGDKDKQKGIKELLGNGDIVIDIATNHNDAYSMIKTTPYDCIILDIVSPDLPSFELLSKIKNEEIFIPVIIYTNRELTSQEKLSINEYGEKTIIKGVKSPERLLEETTLFLHRVDTNLPEDKRKLLKLVHDKESILKGRKILLVDDDMRNVFAMTSIMEEKGINIIVAKNGKESLSIIDKNPDIDLVLMDIMMPEMDGYEAMKKIREQKHLVKLPIIALTAKAMKGDRTKCIEAGANDYLTKPVDPDKLLTMLRVWLYG